MYNNSAGFLTAGNSGLVSSAFAVKIFGSGALVVRGVMPATVPIALLRLWAIIYIFLSRIRIQMSLQRDSLDGYINLGLGVELSK